MDIIPKEITIREVYDGYIDNEKDGKNGGIYAYGGKLDIRPPYQRNFVYKGEKRNNVIKTIMNGYPLNVMYWVKRPDGQYEVLDGQQRTISFCQYIKGEYSVDELYFHSTDSSMIANREKILDYKLLIYICEGTEAEKLKWFEMINIGGEKLSDQELRNAIYNGSWVNDAKRYFSKHGCPAQDEASDYVNGTANRQEILETAINWFIDRQGEKMTINQFMSKHQHDPSAVNLWNYFLSVINWVKNTFTEYRKEMKGVNWGILYNKYNLKRLDPVELEKQIKKLMIDDEVTKKAGIYSYILTGSEKHLKLRAFSEKQRRQLYEKQDGICKNCKKEFNFNEMEADHIIPWSKGGQTELKNGQMLCTQCNRWKSNK